MNIKGLNKQEVLDRTNKNQIKVLKQLFCLMFLHYLMD